MESNYFPRLLEITSKHVPQTLEGLLYKFRSPGKWLELILKERTLYFSKPSDWNDPWDVQTTIDTTCTFDQLLAYHKRILPKESVHNAEIFTHKYIDDPLALHHDINQAWATICRQTGLCSFAGGWKHILLWSYYAKGHTGVALGFAPQKDSELFKCVYPIRYEEHPPGKFFEQQEQTFVNLMMVKSELWKHEDERRVWLDPSGIHPFKKEALVEIIFGVSCTEQYIDLIIELCHDSELHHVKFYKARKAPGMYELERQEIP